MKTQYTATLFAALLYFLLSAPVIAQTQSFYSTNESSALSEADEKNYSVQELNRLLAPIALYPDTLLAQILMASTYPLEIVEAARWSKRNPKTTGKSLEIAMTKQAWDPAVKSLTAVPTVLERMNDQLEWTQQLGDAFLAQEEDVMASVQFLRAQADAAGNLQSNEQLTVKKETQQNTVVYVVESPKPEVIYVPTYNPSLIYGTWPYPEPPYYIYPPTYTYPRGIAFATGILVGAAIWAHFDWRSDRHNRVNININRYNQFNRTTINHVNWRHNTVHRRGVAYRDMRVSNRYQGTSIQTNRGSFSGNRDARRRNETAVRSESGTSRVTRPATIPRRENVTRPAVIPSRENITRPATTPRREKITRPATIPSRESTSERRTRRTENSSAVADRAPLGEVRRRGENRRELGVDR